MSHYDWEPDEDNYLDGDWTEEALVPRAAEAAKQLIQPQTEHEFNEWYENHRDAEVEQQWFGGDDD